MKMKLATAALLLSLTATALAQRSRFGDQQDRFHPAPNIPYDGRFTFVRLNYTTLPGGYFYGGMPAWAHGYPIAEQNLMRIMKEVSYLSPHSRPNVLILWRTQHACDEVA